MKHSFINYMCGAFSLLLSAGLAGCEDTYKVAPLAEVVDLTMTVDNNNLAMGETMYITFDVTDKESQTANEEFDIKLNVTANGLEDATTLFENFPSAIVFGKGESSKTISIPVKKEGISGSYAVNLNAFARGYTIGNASQSVQVADYHYTTISLKNNADNEVRENQTFTLVASVNVPVKEDVTVKVTPGTGLKDKVDEMPSQLVILAGSSTAESDPITMESDPKTTEDETFDINFETNSQTYPLSAGRLKITKIDIHKGMGTQIMDERWLYEDADEMYVSEARQKDIEAWGPSQSYRLMREGDPHPNAGKVLPEGKWKFYRAYEFHNVAFCKKPTKTNDGSWTNEDYPQGFADQNTQAVETGGAVDNARYTWITSEGYLRMITLKEQTKSKRNQQTFNFGTSALYANKFNSNNTNNHNYAPQNIRIYPGMRIEVRARIRGAKARMLPGIWLQGNQAQGGDNPWVVWPAYGEIDVMENNTLANANTVEQTFHVGTIVDNKHYNPTIDAKRVGFSGTVDQFNIYWTEWLDNETVTMGINGIETIRITKAEVEKNGYQWPFTDQINDEGLHLLLTMMFLGKAAPNDSESAAYAGITYQDARTSQYSGADSPIPRMEIDWVRFYTDNTYNTHGKQFNPIILY